MMIPPAMSSTMSGSAVLDKTNDSDKDKKQNKVEVKVEKEEKTPGRPEKDDSEKSDKTIANKEAMD